MLLHANKALLWHMVFEEELGQVKGGFGPLNALAWFPDGGGYVTGGEDHEHDAWHAYGSVNATVPAKSFLFAILPQVCLRMATSVCTHSTQTTSHPRSLSEIPLEGCQGCGLDQCSGRDCGCWPKALSKLT
eukprot:988207-Amphidinium_carterae.2